MMDVRYLKNIKNINKENLDNTIDVILNNEDKAEDIFDSFSSNQFAAKNKLLEMVDDIIDNDSVVVIFGCWYGSILVDRLAPKVKHIHAIDMNNETLNIGKSLFPHYDNVTWLDIDVFQHQKYDFYREARLIINTSCEHMPPMNQWEPWQWIAKRNRPYYAFQSNDIYGIEGHINCVDNIEQFEKQIPKSMIIDTAEIEDTRGTRFTIIGQIC